MFWADRMQAKRRQKCMRTGQEATAARAEGGWRGQVPGNDAAE